MYARLRVIKTVTLAPYFSAVFFNGCKKKKKEKLGLRKS